MALSLVAGAAGVSIFLHVESSSPAPGLLTAAASGLLTAPTVAALGLAGTVALACWIRWRYESPSLRGEGDSPALALAAVYVALELAETEAAAVVVVVAVVAVPCAADKYGE